MNHFIKTFGKFSLENLKKKLHGLKHFGLLTLSFHVNERKPT